jgi:hypothetical protein
MFRPRKIWQPWSTVSEVFLSNRRRRRRRKKVEPFVFSPFKRARRDEKANKKSGPPLQAKQTWKTGLTPPHKKTNMQYVCSYRSNAQ